VLSHTSYSHNQKVHKATLFTFAANGFPIKDTLRNWTAYFLTWLDLSNNRPSTSSMILPCRDIGIAYKTKTKTIKSLMFDLWRWIRVRKTIKTYLFLTQVKPNLNIFAPNKSMYVMEVLLLKQNYNAYKKIPYRTHL